MINQKQRELWLFRHGETAWSRTGQHTGRTDLPLTESGKQRAEALGRNLAGRKFDLVLSSPLARAAETCRLAGYGEVARFSDNLMEWDYGEYEGLRPADILKKRPGWTIWNDGVPRGETIEQVGERARNIVGLTQEVNGNVAIFSHGHLLRILAACWLDLAPHAGRYFDLDTASTSVLGYSRDNPLVRKWNQEIYLAGATNE